MGKDASLKQHQWYEKAEDSLRVIQVNTLEDRSVHNKNQWDVAIKFMEAAVKERLVESEAKIKEMLGPGTQEQWLKWKSQSPEQRSRSATMKELEKLIMASEKPNPVLSSDELTTVRKNLETQNVDVNSQFIRETWDALYSNHFLKMALHKAGECKKGFYYYQQGFS